MLVSVADFLRKKKVGGGTQNVCIPNLSFKFCYQAEKAELMTQGNWKGPVGAAFTS